MFVNTIVDKTFYSVIYCIDTLFLLIHFERVQTNYLKEESKPRIFY